MITILGEFNAKLKPCYLNDITSIEGSKIYFLSSAFGFSQIINEPT